MDTNLLPIEEILSDAKNVNGSRDANLIKKAYDFARRAHEGQKRMSGEPFIIHPIEVAKIISQLKLDSATIAAALLHDVVEDCEVTLDEIRDAFGNEIAVLVDGVTKLSKISKTREASESEIKLAKEEEHFENLRRIFVAMAKDIRVIIIKLADRLHNLRTLCNLSLERQRFIARETLEIFAPLAHRLGIWQVKGELEDLAFSYLEPQQYQALEEQVAQYRKNFTKEIQNVVDTLKSRLEAADIKASIENRPKHLYSVWQKMQKKAKELESIHDLMAVRVLVDSVEDCYATLGIVHSVWMPLHDRIKDYIAKPKSNNYQSIHTTVYGPGGQPFEIQIRTWEMHRIADFGVAAHWHYKQTTKDKNFDKMLAPWITQLREWQLDLKSAKEYVQAFKVDFLESQVFVFTPKGDVFDLPQGSTPLDVAYRVHTDIGHHTVGAKVDGRMVNLDYPLQNGDIVEIVTNKNSAGPSWDWLKLCHTSNAKHKIRAWFKKEKRDEIILEELNEAPKTPLPKRHVLKTSRPKQPVLVKGVDQALIRLSKCCTPVPGDPIVGYITMGSGITIHQTDCPNAKALQHETPERLIEVAWNPAVEVGTYAVEIEIVALDKPGLLGEVLNKIYSENILARSCQAGAKRHQAIIRISLDISDLKRLEELMKKIREVPEVTDVHRVSKPNA